MDMTLRVRADVPEAHYGANVQISIPLPRTTTAATAALALNTAGHQTDFSQADKKVNWTIKKFIGGSEHTLHIKLTLSAPITPSTRKEFGPVSMNFEIPMYNVSNLTVRYLRIAEQSKTYNPYRWVRYVTQSSSYVSRI